MKSGVMLASMGAKCGVGEDSGAGDYVCDQDGTMSVYSDTNEGRCAHSASGAGDYGCDQGGKRTRVYSDTNEGRRAVRAPTLEQRGGVMTHRKGARQHHRQASFRSRYIKAHGEERKGKFRPLSGGGGVDRLGDHTPAETRRECGLGWGCGVWTPHQTSLVRQARAYPV